MQNSIVLKFEVYLCSFVLKVHLDSPSIVTLHTCFFTGFALICYSRDGEGSSDAVT